MASSGRHLLAPSPATTPATPPNLLPPESKFGCFSFRTGGAHHALKIPPHSGAAATAAEQPLFDVPMDSPDTPRFFNSRSATADAAHQQPPAKSESEMMARQARFEVPDNSMGEREATTAAAAPGSEPRAQQQQHTRQPSRQETFSGVISMAGVLSMSRKRSFREEEGHIRVVYINDPDKTSFGENRKAVAGNGVRTSKYTLLSFLPRNLFEQFKRVAYVYFLIIVILNQIPPLAVFGRTASVFPLAFVLVATGIKDAYEDWGRHRSDKAENNRTSLVLQDGFYQHKKWKHIRVGEMVKIHANEVVPADLVVLGTSDANGVAYVETMNLDGESNLKTRYAKQETARLNPENGPIRGTLICEMPNRNIYEFQAYLDLEGVHLPLGPNNILLRGCEVKNTPWVIGVVVYAGKQTKAMLNNSGAQHKRSRLERLMNQATGYLVIFLMALCLVGGLGMGFWVGQHKKYLNQLPYYRKKNYDRNKDFNYYGVVGEGVIAFLSCIIVFQVMVPIALYISLELVRLWQAHFMTIDMGMYHHESNSRFQCRALNINEDLGQVKYIFSDKTGTLTENKMEFHSASIAGAVYSDAQPVEDPVSDIDGIISAEDNAVVLGDRKVKTKAKPKVDVKLLALLQSSANTPERRAAHEYMLVLTACNTIVPTKVTMGSDGKLEMHAAANNDGGQIEYQGESPDEQALVSAAASYGYVLLERSLESILINVMGEPQRYQILGIHEFDSVRKRMSVVMRCPDGTTKVLVKGADSSMLDILAKGAAGDEEINLVEEKHRNGVMQATTTHLDRFSSRGLRTLVVGSKEIGQKEYDNWRHQYDKASTVLNGRVALLRETSALVENDLVLLGATAIEDRLQEGVPDTIALLREAGIKVWVLTGDKQETAISIGFSCQLLTDDMKQIIIHESTKEGALQGLKSAKKLYGIADRDRDRDSGIAGSNNHHHVENSTTSTGPFANNTNGALSTPASFSSGADNSGRHLPGRTAPQQLALIIDGNSLVHALQPDVEDELYQVARACRVVICCRVAPMQKAAIVNLIKQKTGEMTLAIGDGANDVSMIQMADIGIGLSGQEGRQAVMASDFSMGQFRFLKRLLLVHGHWNYQRLSYMILYNFYRNAVFVFMLFWLILYTAYSPQTAITDWSLVFYSLIYTSIPTIVIATMDKNLGHRSLLKFPALYGVGQRAEGYNQLLFWLTMADTVWQSLVLFYIPFLTYRETNIDLYGLGSIWTLGVVLLVNMHLAMDVYRWNWISHVSIWGSIVATFVCMLVLDSLKMDTLLLNYGSFKHILGDAKFYIDILIILPVALLPRFCVKVARQRFWPSDIQIAREAEILGTVYDRDGSKYTAAAVELSDMPRAAA